MTPVLVYGAYGHTGRLVVRDLLDRGLTPVLSGRDAQRLSALTRDFPDVEARPGPLAGVSLDGIGAVINCAGPFGDTPPPLLDAALRAGVHYLDVAGEALVALRTFDAYEAPGSVVAPAVGFFGGLGDLLATAATGDWPDADEVTVAFAMNGWTPTRGSVRTGELRAGRRVKYAAGRLDVLPAGLPPSSIRWTFAPPFGLHEVSGDFSPADIVTISQHLPVREIRAHLYVGESSGPVQMFVVEAVVRRGAQERRASARGQDIYAISASLAGEAVRRVLDGRAHRAGVVALGEVFDAPSFLGALPFEELGLP